MNDRLKSAGRGGEHDARERKAGGASEHKAREHQRLSAALRENLKRRKAQARSRADGEPPVSGEQPHDSAGFGEHKQRG